MKNLIITVLIVLGVTVATAGHFVRYCPDGMGSCRMVYIGD